AAHLPGSSAASAMLVPKRATSIPNPTTLLFIRASKCPPSAPLRGRDAYARREHAVKSELRSGVLLQRLPELAPFELGRRRLRVQRRRRREHQVQIPEVAVGA